MRRVTPGGRPRVGRVGGGGRRGPRGAGDGAVHAGGLPPIAPVRGERETESEVREEEDERRDRKPAPPLLEAGDRSRLAARVGRLTGCGEDGTVRQRRDVAEQSRTA